MSASDRLDRVITSAPANATASRVMGRGTHWEPRSVDDSAVPWQDRPLPMLPAPIDVPPGVIGTRFGRLTVRGYGGRGGKGARWVTRCDCGNWGYRRLSGLRTAVQEPMCNPCDYADQVKRGLVYFDREAGKVVAVKP